MAQDSSDAGTRQAVEAYFQGLSTRDVSRIPLAHNASFVGPMIPEGVRGEPEVRTLLSDVAAGFQMIAAERIFVDGEYACAPFEFTLRDARIPPISGVDCFRVVDGKIVDIQPYYDPRPLLSDEG